MIEIKTNYRRMMVVLCGLVIMAGPLGANPLANASSPRHGSPLAAVSGKAATTATCTRRNRSSGTVTVGMRPGSTAPLAFAIPAMFDGLFNFDSRGGLYPMMAAVIPTIKNGGIKSGGRTIVIRLKRGLRWSDGQEVTSADLRFGWRVSTDPAAGHTEITDIRAIDTPDRYTAVIQLTKVDPTLLSDASAAGAGPVSPEPAVWPHEWNNDPHAAAVKLNQDPSFPSSALYPTDGPYRLESISSTPVNQVVLAPMKYYADMTCGGYLRHLVVRQYASDAALVAAVASHAVDVTSAYSLELISQLQQQATTYKIHVSPSYGIEHLDLNVDSAYAGRANPLDDPRVRLALALAIDKVALIRRVYRVKVSTARNLTAWTPWANTPGLKMPYTDTSIKGQWDPIARRFITDTGSSRALADARRLLSETSWKHGFTLDFFTVSNAIPRQLEESELATDWARIGVQVKAYYVDAAQLFGTWEQGGILDRGLFQVGLDADFGPSDPDGWKFLFESRYIDRGQTKHSPLNQNAGGIRDPLIDRAFERAGRTFNHAIRATEYAIIQRELNLQAYWIPLWFRPAMWTDDGRVRNLSFSAAGSGILWNAYAWRMKSKRA